MRIRGKTIKLLTDEEIEVLNLYNRLNTNNKGLAKEHMKNLAETERLIRDYITDLKRLVRRGANGQQ